MKISVVFAASPSIIADRQYISGMTASLFHNGPPPSYLARFLMALLSVGGGGVPAPLRISSGPPQGCVQFREVWREEQEDGKGGRHCLNTILGNLAGGSEHGREKASSKHSTQG